MNLIKMNLFLVNHSPDYKYIQRDPIIIRRTQQKLAKRAKIQKPKKGEQFQNPENEGETLESAKSESHQSVSPQMSKINDAAEQSEEGKALMKECKELEELKKQLKEKEEWKNKFTADNEKRVQNLIETIERMKGENFEKMKSIEEKDLKILEQKNQIDELKMLAETKNQALLKEIKGLNSLLTVQKKKNEKFMDPLSAQVIQIEVKTFSIPFIFHIILLIL